MKKLYDGFAVPEIIIIAKNRNSDLWRTNIKKLYLIIFPLKQI